jgi:hypothetical protein
VAVCTTVRVEWPRVRQMLGCLDIIRLPMVIRLRFEWLVVRLALVEWSVLRLVAEY